MRLIPLTSSQLAAIGWVEAGDDPEGHYGAVAGRLAVQFQKGGWYLYDTVPEHVFVAVITDRESQGKAFHALVKKGGYDYRQTTPQEIESL
jgi:hypothetical protein